MQVTSLGTQLGLGSELVDWYRDATSVPFDQLLIDLLPLTDNRLRYCTSSSSVPLKLHIPERLKHLRLWTMNTQNLPTLQVFQTIPRICKSDVLQCCPEEFIRFLCE